VAASQQGGNLQKDNSFLSPMREVSAMDDRRGFRVEKARVEYIIKMYVEINI
jgi:hypothetical protein